MCRSDDALAVEHFLTSFAPRGAWLAVNASDEAVAGAPARTLAGQLGWVAERLAAALAEVPLGSRAAAWTSTSRAAGLPSHISVWLQRQGTTAKPIGDGRSNLNWLMLASAEPAAAPLDWWASPCPDAASIADAVLESWERRASRRNALDAYVRGIRAAEAADATCAL